LRSMFVLEIIWMLLRRLVTKNISDKTSTH
jgi:hypothetical protein